MTNEEIIRSDTEQQSLRDGSVKKIVGAVEKGLSFNDACSLVDIRDAEVRDSVYRDALRFLVAEMHYGKGIPLKQLALRLRLSLSRLMNARESMIEDEGKPGELLTSREKSGHGLKHG